MRLTIISILFCFIISCSSDEAFTLKEIASPSGENSSLPRLFTDNIGTVFMSWVESKGDTSTLFYSTLDNQNWTTPVNIASSENWFVNWADFPSVIGRDGKAVAAHWLKKVEGGTYAYNVEIVSAKNNWQNPVSPHTDNTPTEHGFVSMVPISDSTFLSNWLDGRNTGGHGSHDEHDAGSDLSTAMTLRSAVLDIDLNIIDQFEIDSAVCDCCGTSVVKTNNGYITAYRDRSAGEVRDIYVSKFQNGKWSLPSPVHNDNWEIAACPVNGPSIASNEDLVAVAWYTGANDSGKIKIAFSPDEGDSFNEPLVVDNGNPLGRVDIEFTGNETVLITWLERNMEDRSKAYFIAKQFSTNGELLSEIKISDMSSSRRSGFPQISSYNDKIIAAWTNLEENSYNIKTAILE